MAHQPNSHHSGDVICGCGTRFNLNNVEVTHRYADCSTFLTPCCGRQADDRTWVRQPYSPLPDTTRADGVYVYPDGRIVDLRNAPKVTA